MMTCFALKLTKSIINIGLLFLPNPIAHFYWGSAEQFLEIRSAEGSIQSSALLAQMFNAACSRSAAAPCTLPRKTCSMDAVPQVHPRFQKSMTLTHSKQNLYEVWIWNVSCEWSSPVLRAYTIHPESAHYPTKESIRHHYKAILKAASDFKYLLNT